MSLNTAAQCTTLHVNEMMVTQLALRSTTLFTVLLDAASIKPE